MTCFACDTQSKVEVERRICVNFDRKILVVVEAGEEIQWLVVVVQDRLLEEVCFFFGWLNGLFVGWLLKELVGCC